MSLGEVPGLASWVHSFLNIFSVIFFQNHHWYMIGWLKMKEWLSDMTPYGKLLDENIPPPNAKNILIWLWMSQSVRHRYCLKVGSSSAISGVCCYIWFLVALHLNLMLFFLLFFSIVRNLHRKTMHYHLTWMYKGLQHTNIQIIFDYFICEFKNKISYLTQINQETLSFFQF